MIVRRSAVCFAAGALACAGGVAFAGDQQVVYTDASGDAVVRRTDTGNDGVIHPSAALPDMVSATLGGWQPNAPATDPYTGVWIDGRDADIVRIDMVFEGLVNPPGTLGLGGQPFNPFAHGPSPLYGYLEINVDNDKDTGGECGSGAALRYLANVGRFGAAPYGSIHNRAAAWGTDLDSNFNTSPQFERSGQDFSIVLCGCASISVLNRFGDATPATFDAGDTWTVRSRFFQRAGGYEQASGAFGGSLPGLYDPWTTLRFRHEAGPNRTTVTLVYGLTMAGAAALAGTPEQNIDLSVATHTSVIEALSDVIAGADAGGLTGCGHALAERWEGRDAEDYLDPTDWEVFAIFGTTYTTPQSALYVWTDVGVEESVGDFDGSGLVDGMDESALTGVIASRDGGPQDGDGVVNGAVVIPAFASNFGVYDVDGDGVVDGNDVEALGLGGLYGDLNGDCAVNFGDLNLVLSSYNTADPGADVDGDGLVNFTDLNIILGVYNTTCR